MVNGMAKGHLPVGIPQHPNNVISHVSLFSILVPLAVWSGHWSKGNTQRAKTECHSYLVARNPWEVSGAFGPGRIPWWRGLEVRRRPYRRVAEVRRASSERSLTYSHSSAGENDKRKKIGVTLQGKRCQVSGKGYARCYHGNEWCNGLKWRKIKVDSNMAEKQISQENLFILAAAFDFIFSLVQLQKFYRVLRESKCRNIRQWDSTVNWKTLNVWWTQSPSPDLI